MMQNYIKRPIEIQAALITQDMIDAEWARIVAAHEEKEKMERAQDQKEGVGRYYSRILSSGPGILFGAPLYFNSGRLKRIRRHKMDEDLEAAVVECFVETLEGRLQVRPGSYLIKGIKGEYYACDPEIFAKTYDQLVIPEAGFFYQGEAYIQVPEGLIDVVIRQGKRSFKLNLPQ